MLGFGEDETTTADSLPDEVLQWIFGALLQYSDSPALLEQSLLAPLRLVCRRWRRAVDSMYPVVHRNVLGSALRLDPLWDSVARSLSQFSVPQESRAHARRCRVEDLSWRADGQVLASVGSDGYLVVQEPQTSRVLHKVQLGASWATSCSISASGEAVACGGLDTKCSVYDVTQPAVRPHRQRKHELLAHTGPVTCVRFIDDDHLVSASRDRTCRIWDVKQRLSTLLISEHTSEVLSVEVSPADRTVFASSSRDGTVALWDVREHLCVVASVRTRDGSVNSVCWSRSGLAIAAGSDGARCTMYDVRMTSRGAVRCFEVPGGSPAYVTRVAISASGRFVLACANDSVHAWEALSGLPVRSLPHPRRVSALALSHDGSQLATGCWDAVVRTWAPTAVPCF